MWADLPLPKERQVTIICAASITVLLGDGNLALFWKDRWINGRSIGEIAPHLIQAVPRRCINGRTVRDALNGRRRWIGDIWGSRTTPVLHDFVRIWNHMQSIQLSNTPDKFI